MKTLFYLMILIGVAIGSFLLGTLQPGKNVVNATNWVVGNKTNYYTNFAEVTNNTQYLQEVFFDYIHFMGDSFRFIQLNNNIRVDLWKRNFTTKIKNYQLNSGPIIGLGWNFKENVPNVLVGWEFEDMIGLFGTTTISTNFGFSIFGYYKINLL